MRIIALVTCIELCNSIVISTQSYDPSSDFAKEEDGRDPLGIFRDQFHIPVDETGKPLIYFAGNSLGLQPVGARAHVLEILEAWKTRGVDGHFSGPSPWLEYCDDLNTFMSVLVGADSTEVVLMNALTVNLHVLMATFYRPSTDRYKVLVEQDAFPSDRYAIHSHVEWNGGDPEKSIWVLRPREGETLLRAEDTLKVIEESGSEIALVLLGGLNYYTGQVLDMEEITRVAKGAGCVVGFDLAHAAGNVDLQLHDWDVDFAAWCTYKYLNGGPGSPGSIFIHSRYATDSNLPALRGWWGQDTSDRFRMLDEYVPARGAQSFQISNPALLSTAPLKASLDLFDEAGFPAILEKSRRLTGYLEFLLEKRIGGRAKIITPKNPEQRGAQLSIRIDGGRTVFETLKSLGVSCDWREPGVIRMAPVPLYNSYLDVFNAVNALDEALTGAFGS